MDPPSVAVFSAKAASGWFSSRFAEYAAIKHEPRHASMPKVSRKAGRFSQTMSDARVLLFGHIRELALYRAEVLRDRGFNVMAPRDKQEAVEIIRRGELDVAVLSYTLPSDLVQELAELVREFCPGCPLVAISETGRVDRKVNPDEIAIADDGPPALIAALRRVSRRT